MTPNYANWVPAGMVHGMTAGAVVLWVLACMLAGWAAAAGTPIAVGGAALGLIAALACTVIGARLASMRKAFSYGGTRQLSRRIVEGVAAFVDLSAGACGLDVGCGSGALTIACAKRNPQARMVGVDRWGKDYASFSQKLCEQNAQAEGVDNVSFQPGDATALPFADETFDAVTSNYVYHNITGKNKQALLRETLRVLKKGGTFALHDLMSLRRYGDMEAFARQLRAEGYAEVRLVDTTGGDGS